MRFLNFISKYFVSLSFVFWFIGLSKSLALAIRDSSFDNFIVWKVTQFYVSYFNFGFVRRGLIATLLHPLFSRLEGSRDFAIIAIVLLDFLLIFGAIILLNKYLSKGEFSQLLLVKIFKAIIILSPVGIMQFSLDAGRLDHATIILSVISLVLIVHNKNYSASILLGLGMLTHEAIFFFAFPVLFAICISISKKSPIAVRIKKSLTLGSLPIFTMALVAIYGLSDVDISTILPPEFSKGKSAWQRGVLQPSIELSFIQYCTVIFYALVPYVFLTHFYLANKLKPDIIMVATLSAVSLFALGIDYARWCQLIFVSVSIAIAYHAMNGRAEVNINSRGLKVFIIAYLIPLGPIGVTNALPYVETFTRRALGF